MTRFASLIFLVLLIAAIVGYVSASNGVSTQWADDVFVDAVGKAETAAAAAPAAAAVAGLAAAAVETASDAEHPHNPHRNRVNPHLMDDSQLMEDLTELMAGVLSVSDAAALQSNLADPSKPPANTINTRGLTVCSFNIQVFGQKKIQNADVVKALVTTLRQFDVCLIQEIRDDNTVQPAIQQLLRLINDRTYEGFDGKSVTSKQVYEVALSARLGRTNSKEQYGWLYNTKRVKVLRTVQYDDKNNYFERPPFTVHLQGTAEGSQQYVFSGVHISPGTAVSEIDHLVDVYNSMVNDQTLPLSFRQSLSNRYFVMGDLNAGCSYVPKSSFSKIRLRTDLEFRWLVADTWDTTTKDSVCAYDRVVGRTPSSMRYDPVVRDSVGVFDLFAQFGAHIKASDIPKISDHFPIFFTLRY